MEIGVGFIRSSSGNGFYQIWRRSGNVLSLLSTRGLTFPPQMNPQWRAGDFDGDGNEELFAGFLRTTDGSTGFRIWDPQTNSRLAGRYVTGSEYGNHQWIIGDFDTARPGKEILVGFTRISDGAAFFHIWSEIGTLLASRFVTGPDTHEHQWDRISDGVWDLVLVGFRYISNGAWGFCYGIPTAPAARFC